MTDHNSRDPVDLELARLQRLQRIQDARRAGIDLDRDMCAHDYIQGVGCRICTRGSLRLMAAAGTVAFLVFGLLALLLVDWLWG